RVRLEFLPYPQVIPPFCNTGGSGPRRGLTPASPCPWVAHPVSGLIPATPRGYPQVPRPCALFRRLAFAAAPPLLPGAHLAVPLGPPPPERARGQGTLAAAMNSPDHSTKGTPSPPGSAPHTRRGAPDSGFDCLSVSGFRRSFTPPAGSFSPFP